MADNIDRTGAGALIPEQAARDIIKRVTETSAARRLFRKGPNMSTSQTRIPVLSTLPHAYFVNGDMGMKKLTAAAWANKYLNVEEIAAIAVVPDALVSDAAYDIWGEIKPYIVEAIGDTLDGAVFLGVNKPDSWPEAVVPAAVAAGNVFVRGTNVPADGTGGVAQDLSDLMTFVEDDGFDVDGFAASRKYKGILRSQRDTTGQKLLDVAGGTYDGLPIVFTMRGLWPAGASQPELITGDFTQGILSIRQDITWTTLTEATFHDEDGKPVINLAQQDAKAIRVVFRVAWQVANTVTKEQENEEDRYPFAVMNGPA